MGSSLMSSIFWPVLSFNSLTLSMAWLSYLARLRQRPHYLSALGPMTALVPREIAGVHSLYCVASGHGDSAAVTLPGAEIGRTNLC